MSRRIKIFFTLWMLAGWVWLDAGAAPLRRADVALNPSIVVHLDSDALRQTFLGKYLIYQMDRPELSSNMLSMQTFFTFDFRTQFHGMTYYNADGNTNEGTFLLYADINPTRFVALLRDHQPVKTTTNHDRVIYGWIDKGQQTPRFAAIEKSRMALSKDRESVVGAIAVLDGRQANFAATSQWPQLGAGPDGVFLQGAATKLDLTGTPASWALLRNAKRIQIQAGERNEQLTVTLTLEAADESTASQINMAAQGFSALLSLQQGNPYAARIAKALDIRQTGARVAVSLVVPSIDLINAIKTASPKK